MLKQILGSVGNMYMDPLKKKFGMGGGEGAEDVQDPKSPYKEYLMRKAAMQGQQQPMSPFMEYMNRQGGR